MAFLNKSVFSALTDKMRWHQTRQGLLAENVANAETPGCRGRDLAQYDLADSNNAFSSATVTTTATQPNYFPFRAAQTRPLASSAWSISRLRRKAIGDAGPADAEEWITRTSRW